MSDRHQFRADWHDYNGGIYFITICCAEKRHYLGEIVGTRFFASDTAGTPPTSEFIPTELGEIVDCEIKKLSSYYNDVEIWNYVVMPNHIHMVLIIDSKKTDANDKLENSKHTNYGCLKPPRHGSPTADWHHNSRLASLIGSFKAGVTREGRTRRIASLQSGTIWQERFHEHIIRNQRAYEYIMSYIDSNVENWCYDRFNENRIDNADAPWRKFAHSETTGRDANFRVRLGENPQSGTDLIAHSETTGRDANFRVRPGENPQSGTDLIAHSETTGRDANYRVRAGDSPQLGTDLIAHSETTGRDANFRVRAGENPQSGTDLIAHSETTGRDANFRVRPGENLHPTADELNQLNANELTHPDADAKNRVPTTDKQTDNHEA